MASEKRNSNSGVVASLRSIFSRDGSQQGRVASKPDKLLSECLQKLSKDIPLEKRIAFVEEFCDFLSQYRIDRMYLEHIWSRVKDFFDIQHPPEAKKAGLRIIRTLAKYHHSRIGIINAECWQLFLNDPSIDVDTIKTFSMLTGNGREISPFEYEVGRVIVAWLRKLPKEDREVKQELLTLMSNIIKFNFTVIPEDQRTECIIALCEISNTATAVAVIKLCLDCFDEIVKYSKLPSSCIVPFISSLCCIVNIERFSVFTWQVMKNVIQTYAQLSIQPLCGILDDPQKPTNLLRGATFFLGMSMWGSQRVASLDIPALQILPSMNRVLDSEEPIIGHEVCLAIRRLIKKYGTTLHLEWDLLITIFDKLRTYLLKVRSQRFMQMLSETVESIIALIQQGTFSGDLDEVYPMLMKYVSLLSEESNILLLNYERQFMHPGNPKWLLSLKKFAHYFYQIPKHASVRLLALEALKKHFKVYESLYAEQIIRTLFSVFNDTLEKEVDDTIRVEALQFLGYLLQHSSAHASIALIDLLGKHAKKQKDAAYILVETFKKKWTKSQFAQTIKIYHLLIELLNHPHEPAIRKASLQCLLQIRSNQNYQVLLNGVRSSFLQIDVSTKASVLTRKHQGTGSLNIFMLLNVLVNRLLKETSAELFGMCMKGLLSIFCNNFMLAGSDLNILTNALLSELKANRFASTVENISKEERVLFLQDAYHLIGLLLIGYRRYLHRSQPQALVDLIVSSCTEEKHETIRIICLNILAACCIDFPAGVSYKSSSIVKILDSVHSHNSHVAGFIACFINSPKTLSRTLSEQDLTTLFSIVASLSSPFPGKELESNNMFRHLVLLLLSCTVKQRQNFFRTISQILLKDTSCLLTESNIDYLSLHTYSDTIIDHNPSEEEENSIIFSPSDQITHYLLGNALLSIQIGAMNWIKTSIRRPSGRIAWISQIQNRPKHRNLKTKVHYPQDVYSPFIATLHNLPPQSRTLYEAISPTSSFENFLSPSDSMASLSDFSQYASLEDFALPPPTDEKGILSEEHNELGESWSFDHAFGDSSPQAGWRPRRCSSFGHDNPTNQSQDQDATLSPQADSHLTSEPGHDLSFGFTNEVSPEDANLVFLEDDLIYSTTSPMGGTEEQKSCATALPLSCFYPPLPSYEEVGDPSPSFHEEGDFFLGPSPDLVKENKLSEDAQMLLHASHSPIHRDHSLLHFPTFEQPTAESLLQGSPIDSQISTSTPKYLAPAKKFAERMSPREKEKETSPPPRPENSMEFIKDSSGQVTIKKSRSITAPTLRNFLETTPTSTPSSTNSSAPLEAEAIHPSFIFLQLQQVPYLSDKAIVLENSEDVERSMKLLDITKPKDTYKFGICYVGDGQKTEEEILGNTCGSSRYDKFLRSMGKYVRLKDCNVYSGGLNRTNDADGKWSIYFEDEVIQIMFHVVTMMAHQQSDGLSATALKKRHIGNNMVNIIYSDCEEEFDINTFAGQFNLINVVIKPLEADMCLIDVLTKDIGKQEFTPTFFPIVVSQDSAPVIVRETVIRAELACRNIKKRSLVPNRQERLKLIRKLKQHESSCSHTSFPPKEWLYNPKT